MPSLHLNLSSLVRRLSYGSRLNPSRDWSILLTVAALTLTALTIGNVLTFRIVTSGGTLGTVKTPTAPAFSQASLDTIREVFDGRAAENARYQDGTYRFTDPSQ